MSVKLDINSQKYNNNTNYGIKLKQIDKISSFFCHDFLAARIFFLSFDDLNFFQFLTISVFVNVSSRSQIFVFEFLEGLILDKHVLG